MLTMLLQYCSESPTATFEPEKKVTYSDHHQSLLWHWNHEYSFVSKRLQQHSWAVWIETRDGIFWEVSDSCCLETSGLLIITTLHHRYPLTNFYLGSSLEGLLVRFSRSWMLSSWKHKNTPLWIWERFALLSVVGPTSQWKCKSYI